MGAAPSMSQRAPRRVMTLVATNWIKRKVYAHRRPSLDESRKPSVLRGASRGNTVNVRNHATNSVRAAEGGGDGGGDGVAGGKKDMYKGWPFSPARASNGLAGLKGDLKGS
jgi:hypothetical protein